MLLTAWANPMVRNDARISVRQAFSAGEVLSLRERAGIGYAKFYRHLRTDSFLLAPSRRLRVDRFSRIHADNESGLCRAMLSQALRKSRFGVALAIGSIVIALIAAAPATLAPRDQQWHHIPPDALWRGVASRRKLQRYSIRSLETQGRACLKSSARLQRLPVRRELIRFGTIPLILHAEQSRLILTGITRPTHNSSMLQDAARG